MRIKSIVTLSFLIATCLLFGQKKEKNSFIILKSNDTIFTKKLNYNWKDKPDFLTYKDPKNQIKYISDSLVSFYYSNKIKHIIAYNKVLKQKFICRELLSGKIDVYEVINNGLNREFYIESESYSGFIDNLNFESTLIPVLNSCPNFNLLMVREKSFLLTQHYIRYYNKNCQE